MLKIGSLTWILLTSILIFFVVGSIVFLISKKVHKYVFFYLEKIKSINFDDLKNINFKKLKINNFFKKKEGITIFEKIIEDSDEKEKKIIIKKEKIEFSNSEKEYLIKKKKILEKIVYESIVLKNEGKFDEYEKKIIEGLAIDSDDKDLNKLLADYYFNTGNTKKSLPLLKKIIEIDSHDHKAIWQIGEIYLNHGDFQTAELLISKAININSTNPKYYISLVELFYNTDRKKESIDMLEKIVRLRPTNTTYIITLADLYLEIGDFYNAQKYYFKVLEYEPNNEKAKKKLKSLNESV